MLLHRWACGGRSYAALVVRETYDTHVARMKYMKHILAGVKNPRREPAAAGRTHSPAAVPLFSGLLEDFEELEEAGRLYRTVFHYEHTSYALNSNLLSALGTNGGSTVGVRRDAPDGPLVGFAYGFAGTDGRGWYHYSQAAVVDASVQGHGVGRMLKLRQGEGARSWGATSMRWSYDPLFARNGHFNLNSLGGVGVRFAPDYYGRPHSDREIVEWDLTAAPDPHTAQRRLAPGARLADGPLGEAVEDESGAWVPVPANVVAGQAIDAPTAAVRDRLHDALLRLHDRGLVLVACHRLTPGVSVYRAAPATRESTAARSASAAGASPASVAGRNEQPVGRNEPVR